MEIATRPRRGVRVVAAVGLVALATRLPFAFGAGLGSDPDSWRLLLAGQYLARTGQYRTSRPPGYPLVELVAAMLHGAPLWVFTLLTAAVGALGVAAFADLLQSLGVRAWQVATAGLAFTPVVARTAVSFMDYSWAFGPLLASMALVARRQWVAAGVAFGLAVACRPSTLVAVVPIAVVLVAGREGWARFGLPAAGVALGFLAVPLVTFGPAVVTAAPEHVGAVVAIGRATAGVWGLFGAVAVSAALVARGFPSGPWCAGAAAGVVAQLLVFAALPADPGYLLPLVPLVWLLLAYGVSTRVLAAAAVVVAVSAFWAPSPSPVFGRTVPADRELRLAAIDATAAELSRIRALPPGTEVALGSRMPQLLAALPPDELIAGSDRSLQIPARVVLSGGQVIVYG